MVLEGARVLVCWVESMFGVVVVAVLLSALLVLDSVIELLF